MNVIPIFAVGIGLEKASEALEAAREMFIENKDLLKEIPEQPNHFSSLAGYKRNTFVSEHKDTPNLNKVKNTIRKNAHNFLVSCGYDDTKNDVEIANVWLNEMKSGATHKVHLHYGYQISGCYYVDVPENSGSISFLNFDINAPFGEVKSKMYTPFNSVTCQITPSEGDMFFWRSDLQHQVFGSEFDGIRRSIAFDINVIDK